MIDPKELRIGNWATIDNPMAWPEMAGIPVIVTSVEEGFDLEFPESKGTIRLKDEHHTYCQYSEFISPIPLTPEWLERLGFEVETTFYVYHLKYEHALTIENGKMYLSNEEGAPESIEIKYVHQLQNLFFALTGEEL